MNSVSPGKQHLICLYFSTFTPRIKWISFTIRGGARATFNFRRRNQVTAASMVLLAITLIHINHCRALMDNPYTRTTAKIQM